MCRRYGNSFQTAKLFGCQMRSARLDEQWDGAHELLVRGGIDAPSLNQIHVIMSLIQGGIDEYYVGQLIGDLRRGSFFPGF